MIVKAVAAVAWMVAGVLLLLPTAIFAAGVSVDAWWWYLLAYLCAAVGAALRAVVPGSRSIRAFLWVLAAGWGLAALGLILWVWEVQAVAAAVAAIGGVSLAIAVLLTRFSIPSHRVAIAITGVLSGVFAVANLATLPSAVGIVIVLMTGASYVVTGAIELRFARLAPSSTRGVR